MKNVIRAASLPARLLPLVPLLVALIAGPALAQGPPREPLVTDRPDFTESAVTVPTLQLEAGYTFTRAGEADAHSFGELLLRVPLSGRIELRLGANSLIVRESPGDDATGVEDASLGFKLALAPGSGAAPAVAVIAGATLPTGSNEFGSDHVQPGATLSLAWDLTNHASLGWNGGYAYVSEAGARFSEWASSLALGYALAPRLGGYGEVYGFLTPDEQGGNSSFINGGLTYLLTADLQLDARIGAGIDGGDAGTYVGVGVSHRW